MQLISLKVFDLIFEIIFTILTIIIIFVLHLQLKKTEKLAKKAKSKAKLYGQNIISGIVAGIIVILLDKSITTFLNNPPTLSLTSFLSFVNTFFPFVILLTFEVGLIFLLIVWIVNKGLKGVVEK